MRVIKVPVPNPDYTITIEGISAEDARVLRWVVGHIAGRGPAREAINRLYTALQEAQIEGSRYDFSWGSSQDPCIKSFQDPYIKSCC